MLGADHVIATRMVVEDGLYTGEIEFYAYAENKADGDRELAEAEGYDLSRSYAYSDSVTDVPMLEAVGHPHAVNPDRASAQRGRGARLAGAGVHPTGAPAQSSPASAAAAEHAGGRRGERRCCDCRGRLVRRGAERGQSTVAACRTRDTPRRPAGQVKNGCGPFPRTPLVRYT